MERVTEKEMERDGKRWIKIKRNEENWREMEEDG